MSHGVLAVWSSITPEAAADYDAWYEREHMFERLEVPGIRRARHYVTVEGAPQFFTWFELEASTVVAGEAYLAQSNRSSPWTQRILPHFRDMTRTAFTVERRAGRGFGAAAMTVRLGWGEDAEPARLARLRDELVPALAVRSGVMGAQLWRADLASTLQPGQDRDLRPGEDRTAALALLVEATRCETLLGLAAEPEFAASLRDPSEEAAPAVAIHQLLNGAEAGEAPPI